MAKNPEYNKRSPDVSSGIYNSGENSQNNIVFTSAKPEAPSQFSATNGEFTDKIILKWIPQEKAILYILYRNFENIASVKPENLQVDSDGLFVYEDTTATPGILYNYYVKTRFDNIESEKSNSDTGSRKLSPPEIITASFGLYYNYIELNWSSVPYATSYKLYRIYKSNEDYKLYAENEPLTITTETKYYDYEPNPNEEVSYFVVSSTGIDETDSDISTIVTGKKSNIIETPTLTASKGTYSDKVLLIWNNTQNAINFKIYRDNEFIGETKLQRFEDKTAIPGKKHYYYVVAYNQYGYSEVSTNSEVVGIRKLLPPTIRTVPEDNTETQIKLKWSASQGFVYKYRIYRGTTFVNPSENMEYIDSVDGNVYEYTDLFDTDMSYNTVYYYTIIAVAEDAEDYGDSIFSNFTTGSLITPTPSEPQNVSASQGNYTNQILISWDPVTYASYYIVFRNNIQIATVTGTSYTDSSSLTSCLDYQYNIKAVNNLNSSSDFSEPGFGYVGISTPTGLVATDTIRSNILDATEINVTWNAVNGATNYKIYRSTENSLLSMVEIATSATNSYTDVVDTDLLKGVRYYYCVKASCAFNDSSFSNIDSGILDDATGIEGEPDPATSLIASDGLLDKITLTWNAPTFSPITGYKIYRNDIQIGITTGLTYEDTTATPGTLHTYKVKTYNQYGDSVFSNSDTGFIKLSTPTGVNVNVGASESETGIKISWDSVLGATNYTIFRGTIATSLSELDTVSNLEYFDTNTDLSYNTTYFYKVRANSPVSGANSSQSSICFGQLKSPLPENFTISVEDGVSYEGIKITWTPSQHAYNGYKILRDGVEIADGPSNYFTYSDDLQTSDLYPPDGWGKFSGTTPTPSTYSFAPVVLGVGSLPAGFTISTNNGTKITFTSDSNNGIYHLISPQVGEIYTASVYAVTEEGEVDFVIGYNDGISIQTGQFTATTTPQRFTLTFRASSNKFSSNIFISNDNLSSGEIIFFGAQLEKGINATDYIPTESEPVISTSFFDITASPETIYTYKVKALNSTGETESVNSLTGSKKNETPIILTASIDKSDIIRLEIETKATSASTLSIYRGTDDNTNDNTDAPLYTLLETISVTGNFMTYDDNDVSLSDDKKYYYKVKTTYSGIDSDYSNEKYGEITGLSTPYDPSDYEVFALDMTGSAGYWSPTKKFPLSSNKINTQGRPAPQNAFDIDRFNYATGVEPYIKFDGSNNIVYNPDYPYKAIVQSPPIPLATGTELNGILGADGLQLTPYNSHRAPNSTVYNWVGSIPTNFENWANIMKLIPSGRRFIQARIWDVDSNGVTTQHVNYYKEKTTDGIAYPKPEECAPGVLCSKKYLGIWQTQNAADSKSHFNSFLNRCKQFNVIFDYVQLDRENYAYMHYLNSSNQKTVNTQVPVARSDAELGYYNMTDTSLNVRIFSDPRFVDAITNDKRFYDPNEPGSLHPITGLCFADEFMNAVRDLWAKDVHYKNKLFPTGVTWQDLLFPFRETNQEKINTRAGLSPGIMVGGLSPSSGGNATTNPTNDQFRAALNNYYIQTYRCNTGAGTNELRPNTSCLCVGMGVNSAVTGGPSLNSPTNACDSPCGPLGAENAQLKSAFTGKNNNPTASPSWPVSYFSQNQYDDMKIWYLTWINQDAGTNGTSNSFAAGYPKLTGYALFHIVANAWNAVVFNWLHNYIGYETYSELWKPTSPEYNHAKFINYSNPASTADEASFFQMSNNERMYRINYIEDTSFTGLQSYGQPGNIIISSGGGVTVFPPRDGSALTTTQQAFPSSQPTNARTEIDRMVLWNNNYIKTLSGYVKNPQNDYEKYSWMRAGGADQNFNTDGRCNSGNLINYPETVLIKSINGVIKYIPEVEKTQPVPTTATIDRWYSEICYKMLVDDIKKSRLQLRSTKSYSPWTNSSPDGLLKGVYKWSFGYWYELIYHFILNKTGPLNTWDENDYSTGNRKYLQLALDEWRNVSKNTKPIPCSNSTGDINLPVDRLLLADVFEKYLISGGKLELPNSTQYIWRISIPPKFFDPATGIATLQRVGDDADLPEFIEVDSKLDTVASNKYHNSRGVWIKRNISTPPNYIPVSVVNLSSTTENRPYDPEEDFENTQNNNISFLGGSGGGPSLEDQTCEKCLDDALKKRNDEIQRLNDEYDAALKEIFDGIVANGQLSCDQLTQYGSKPQYCCTTSLFSKLMEALLESIGYNDLRDLFRLLLEGAGASAAAINSVMAIFSRLGSDYSFGTQLTDMADNTVGLLPQLGTTASSEGDFWDRVLKEILNRDYKYLKDKGYIQEIVRRENGSIVGYVLTAEGKTEILKLNTTDKVKFLFGKPIEEGYEGIINDVQKDWLNRGAPSRYLPDFHRPDLPTLDISRRNAPWYIRIGEKGLDLFRKAPLRAIRAGAVGAATSVPIIEALVAVYKEIGSAGGFGKFLVRDIWKALKKMSLSQITKILLKLGLIAIVAEIIARLLAEYLECMSTGNGAFESIDEIYNGKNSCRKFNGCCDPDKEGCGGGSSGIAICLGKKGVVELNYRNDVIECCIGRCQQDVDSGRLSQKPIICEDEDGDGNPDKNLPPDPTCKKQPEVPPIQPDDYSRRGEGEAVE